MESGSDARVTLYDVGENEFPGVKKSIAICVLPTSSKSVIILFLMGFKEC